jgi:hypothetical protein
MKHGRDMGRRKPRNAPMGDLDTTRRAKPPKPNKPPKFVPRTSHGTSDDLQTHVPEDMNLEVFNIGFLLGHSMAVGDLPRLTKSEIVKTILRGVMEGLASRVGRKPKLIASYLGMSKVNVTDYYGFTRHLRGKDN